MKQDSHIFLKVAIPVHNASLFAPQNSPFVANPFNIKMVVCIWFNFIDRNNDA